LHAPLFNPTLVFVFGVLTPSDNFDTTSAFFGRWICDVADLDADAEGEDF